MDIFERASRLKLRFETSKGQLSAEDLWDLPLTSARGQACLNGIAIDLHGRLKDEPIFFFVGAAPAADPTLQLRFDVVKHVIDARVADNAAAAEAREKLARVCPADLSQAARISGITPADVAVLMIHLETH